MKEYANLMLRINISLMFLWFGINQIINTNMFIGYVPDWAAKYGNNLIIFNGIFETILGFFLLIGLFTKFTSIILSLHLMLITMNLGYNDLAIRDMVLTVATMVVFMNGPDKWTLDEKIHRKELLKKAVKAHNKLK